MLLDLVEQTPIADVEVLGCVPAIPAGNFEGVLDHLCLGAILHVANNSSHTGIFD